VPVWFCRRISPAAIWYDFDVLGIDQGISVLIAENRRSELILGNFHAQPRGDALRGFQAGNVAQRSRSANPLS